MLVCIEATHVCMCTQVRLIQVVTAKGLKDIGNCMPGELEPSKSILLELSKNIAALVLDLPKMHYFLEYPTRTHRYF